MALPQADFDFLRSLYNASDPSIPVEPDDPRFEPWDVEAAGDDPVELLAQHIRFSAPPSLQLFSGFRGSGKTTQLYRLRKELRAHPKYIVLYGNALAYLNPAEELSLEMLLIALAGAYSDALEEAGILIANESYWSRLRLYLTTTEIVPTQVGGKVRIESPLKDLLGGGRVDFDVKAELKETPSFRQKLRDYLRSRTRELRDQVHAFVEEGVTAAKSKYGGDAEVVFLFDSLEQLRGSVSNEKDVYRSVEIVFSIHLEDLRLPYVHTVYCVPPWLQFAAPNSARISVTIPTVRLWNRDNRRRLNQPAWRLMRSALRRRFPSDDLDRFFGPPNQEGHHPLGDLLIGKSGGHFRDLLNLFREAVRRAQSLPITEREVTAAINSVTESFRPIAKEDAAWLKEISVTRQAALPDTSPESVARLTRFLDTHFVLFLKNGEGWYDVHPLVLDELDNLVDTKKSL